MTPAEPLDQTVVKETLAALELDDPPRPELRLHRDASVAQALGPLTLQAARGAALLERVHAETDAAIAQSRTPPQREYAVWVRCRIRRAVARARQNAGQSPLATLLPDAAVGDLEFVHSLIDVLGPLSDGVFEACEEWPREQVEQLGLAWAPVDWDGTLGVSSLFGIDALADPAAAPWDQLRRWVPVTSRVRLYSGERERSTVSAVFRRSEPLAERAALATRLLERVPFSATVLPAFFTLLPELVERGDPLGSAWLGVASQSLGSDLTDEQLASLAQLPGIRSVLEAARGVKGARARIAKLKKLLQ